MNGAVPMLAIDGPSGAGKGTVAGLLARRLGWNLLDSGALYRLLAFAAVNHGVDPVSYTHLDVYKRQAATPAAYAACAWARGSS